MTKNLTDLLSEVDLASIAYQGNPGKMNAGFVILAISTTNCGLVYNREKQPKARAISVARGIILSSMLSEFKFSITSTLNPHPFFFLVTIK